jgi:hypothetical protein
MNATTLAVVIAAGLFLGYLLVQVRPGRSRRRKELDSAIRAARLRAMDAKTDADRAEALTAAGELAAKSSRWTSAAGLFLRALRAHPASADVVRRTSAALALRPRLLESILLRRVAASAAQPGPDADEALVASLEGLAEIYGRRHDKGRARLVERLLAREKGVKTSSSEGG